MKTSWALGAAFVAVVLVLLVFSVLATEMGSADRLSSTEKLDGIDVPTIGTVGDFPDPAHRVVVNVTADGTIVVDGGTLTFDALKAELKRRAELTPGEQIIGTVPPRWISGAGVVLRLDGALPWGAALDVYTECFMAGFRYVTFAVRDETDGAEGAVAVFGSTMGDHGEMISAVDPTRARRGAYVVIGPGDGSPGALYATLAASKPPGAEAMCAYLDLDPRLPTREALALLDASLRAGVRWGTFIRPGLGMPESAPEDGRVCRLEDFETELRRPRAPGTTYDLAVADDDVVRIPTRPPIAMPPIPRVHGRAAGITWGHDRYEIPK